MQGLGFRNFCNPEPTSLHIQAKDFPQLRFCALEEATGGVSFGGVQGLGFRV